MGKPQTVFLHEVRNIELCFSFPSLHSPPALAQGGFEPCSICVCLYLVSQCMQHPKVPEATLLLGLASTVFQTHWTEKKKKKRSRQRGITSLLKVQWGAQCRACYMGLAIPTTGLRESRCWMKHSSGRWILRSLVLTFSNLYNMYNSRITAASLIFQAYISQVFGLQKFLDKILKYDLIQPECWKSLLQTSMQNAYVIKH